MLLFPNETLWNALQEKFDFTLPQTQRGVVAFQCAILKDEFPWTTQNSGCKKEKYKLSYPSLSTKLSLEHKETKETFNKKWLRGENPFK